VSQELERRTGKKADGLLIPWNLPITREHRSLTVSTGVGAVAVQLPPRTIIDVLRQKRVIDAMGGKTLRLVNAPGLVAVPRKTGTATGAWVAEGSAASASNLQVGQVSFSPRTVSATTNVSRRLLTLGEPGFETNILEDLVEVAASMIDAAGINGGGGSAPTGILQSVEFDTVTLTGDAGNGAAPAYADLVSLESTLGQLNTDAAPDGKIGLVTSPQGRSKLRRTDLGTSGAGSKFLWDRVPMVFGNELQWIETALGYRAMATNAVPANLTRGSGTNTTAIILGDWSTILTVFFGPLELIVNPYLQTSAGNANIGVSLFQDVDIRALRHESVVNVFGILTN
jgi:HK97 family phage major capsid protein